MVKGYLETYKGFKIHKASAELLVFKENLEKYVFDYPIFDENWMDETFDKTRPKPFRIVFIPPKPLGIHIHPSLSIEEAKEIIDEMISDYYE